MSAPFNSSSLRRRDRFLILLGRILLRSVSGFLRWSSKIELQGRERLDRALTTGRPVILASWHDALVTLLLFRTSEQAPPMLTMVSRSRDGEIAARIAQVFGIDAVRGSSSRGGAAALLQFTRRLGADAGGPWPWLALHLLDGPLGPRHRSKPGILLLARRSNALILPVVLGTSRRWVARSWDRHRIPLPFGRCVCLIGDPIDPIADAAEPSRDSDRLNSPARDSDEGITTERLDEILYGLAQTDPLCRRDEAPS
jgi:lysophospholipid acyltransferase (LPLAT)-like uncharacterized protein